MKTYTLPDQKWLHGVEDGIEYCLGRPSGMKLHFNEAIGFAIEEFLPAITPDSDYLIKTMRDFADKKAVSLEDPKVRALVHMLKAICDDSMFVWDINAAAFARDRHEIVELRSLLAVPNCASPRDHFLHLFVEASKYESFRSNDKEGVVIL